MVNCFKAFICYFQLTIVFFLTLIAILKSLIFLILVAQYIYIYYFYLSCVTEYGMIMIQDTNYNEIIGFFKQFPFISNLLIFHCYFLFL